MILQAGVLGEKEVAAFVIRHAVFFVVPERGQPLVDLLPLRHFGEKIEGEFVLRFDPLLCLLRVSIFQRTIRVGHLGAVIIIALLALRRRRIRERFRRLSRERDGETSDENNGSGEAFHRAFSIAAIVAGGKG